MEYQIRYVCYAESLGLTPGQAMRRDEDVYPGGVMCGFILWTQKKWCEWEEINGKHPIKTKEIHAAFDRWLCDAIKNKWQSAFNKSAA